MRITLARSGQKYGPFSLDQVNSMLIAGKAAASDLAWIEGTPDWVALGSVPGIVAVPPPLHDRPLHDHAAGDGPPPRELDLDNATSDRLILPAFLLAFFLGVFGAHRFYAGRTGSAVAMVVVSVTMVGLIVTGIWATVDWIIIVCGEFRDADGKKLRRWT